MHPNGRNNTNFHHISSDFEINFVDKMWQINMFVAHACVSAAAKVSAQTSTEHNTVKQSWSDSMFFFFVCFYKTVACFIAQSSVCSGF